MADDIDNTEEIAAYLRENMTAEDRLAFERRLATEPELRQDVRTVAEIDAGLQLLQRVEADHTDSLLLARYAENRGSLSRQELAVVEEHLLGCQSCSEELELCREALGHGVAARRAMTTSIWQRLRDWLLLRPLQLRPAYALATMVLLVAVGFFAGRGPDVTEPVRRFSVSASSDRGEGTENVVTVDKEVQVVALEFVEPVLKDHTYDFELYDDNSLLVLTKPGNQPQIPFAWLIPSKYLPSGNYSVHVIERNDEGQEKERFKIAFSIELAR